MRAQWLAWGLGGRTGRTAAGSLCGAVLLLASTAGSEPLPAGLTRGETLAVVAVIDGETARLADGSELRLASILAPAPAPPRPGQSGRADTELERLKAAAREALATLIDGQTITLHSAGEPRRDRHGRRLAYVTGPADDWVQAALVEQGLARVYTTAETSAGAATLLRLEAVARDQRLGLWRHAAFQVRHPNELGRWIETFQLVEGAAVSTKGARPAGRLTVEAGDAHLTLTLSTRARNELRGLGDLEGRPVRVRGWVRWQNGPAIDVTHGAAIELMTGADGHQPIKAR